jgi:hypothetical protein
LKYVPIGGEVTFSNYEWYEFVFNEKKKYNSFLYLWSFNTTTFFWINGLCIRMDGEVDEEANDVTIVITGTTTNQGKNIL